MMDFTKMSLEEIGNELNRINHTDRCTFEDRARKAMLDAEYARRKSEELNSSLVSKNPSI